MSSALNSYTIAVVSVHVHLMMLSDLNEEGSAACHLGFSKLQRPVSWQKKENTNIAFVLAFSFLIYAYDIMNS